MSEDKWAQQKEWENERGELEINSSGPAAARELCCARKCKALATRMYEVVTVGRANSGMEINLCADHDDQEAAFTLYRFYNEAP